MTRLQDTTPIYIMIQPYSVQIISSNINSFKPTKLKSIKSASLLSLLNVTFFNLVTF